MYEQYFHCNRRDMLVARDLSDCVGCPLRELIVSDVLTICDQYAEGAKAKLRAKLGLPEEIPILNVPPTDVINQGLL